ncbi:PD-(D/E)XK nuclease family protein [Metasolibacillus fluoroglycofenilyticus]|uniref:PD-(D/E)XK nuclease family protein n=1 Tax=Metasolibacillus fluoroglycofenilyticus TaxID=1239396 RepID=UPI000D36F7B4|nr:PD-(D/E)XK nuclease family protein [Metasolibacillus fluoroglycofenilyticus]
MNKNNFVNVVGYQLEKVHTGVIKWIMDSQNNSVSLDNKYAVLKKLFAFCGKSITFNKQDIESIICTPEFSFGRKRKIDLVIKVNLFSGQLKYIVIEMKVDSIPYDKQLDGTFQDFVSTINSDKDTCFMLFLFGSSQVCTVPTNKNFSVCRIKEIIHFFNHLQIQNTIYFDWIESLIEEKARLEKVSEFLLATDNLWDTNYWLENGYRIWFSLFYYLYNQLKMESNMPEEWEIYSGSNNPVMNWTPGWKSIVYNDKPLSLYWEFNYEELVLKVKVDNTNPIQREALADFRTKIATICENSPIKTGKKTKNTYGIYNSLYKWHFNFKEQTFHEIMSNTEDILKKIHPQLHSL